MKTTPFIIIFYLLHTLAIAGTPVKLLCEYLTSPLGIDNPNPRLSWQISDSVQNSGQTAWQILIDTDSATVTKGEGKIWNSGKVISGTCRIPYYGSELQPFTTYYWTVKYWDQKKRNSSYAPVSRFETGMMTPSNWQGNWISDGNPIDYRPAPYFRKTISIKKKIKSARAYTAVSGLYELYVNGVKIGDRILDPMFTRFDRRTLYTTLDITPQLKEGENAIGLTLGNGWYNLQSKAVWFFEKAPWRSRPKFCMDVRITYEDGTSEIISTDQSWKTTDSPIIFNSIYSGEYFDAGKEITSWCLPDFKDSSWKSATLTGAPSQNIVSQQLHPIRVTEELTPVSVKKIDPKTYVFSFPRNIAGITRLQVQGPAGTEITLKHGEKLYESGLVDFETISKRLLPGPGDPPDPFGTDVYTLKGIGSEIFSPHFNYKGFQFVEVRTSVPMELGKTNLTALVVHSDVPKIGEVRTSNSLINKLFEATNNSYLNNLYGYPTDCPHREKNGWTGDAHIAIETALYSYDGITIYEKWLNDHLDEQLPNGTLPNIIPCAGWGYHWANGSDWVSSIAIIPWQIYQFYGDKTLLDRTYNSIKKYVDLLERKSKDGLIDWALGDWSPIHTKSNTEYISSLYFFQDAKILSEAAILFDRGEDHSYYSKLAVKIKSAINTKFLNKETAIYAGGSQTELSAALYYKIVPEDIKCKVVDKLVKKIHESNDHIDIGLLGAKTLFNSLSENGQADLAFKLLAQDTHPSFGYYIANGATTLYEGWNPDKNKITSLNHIMFGECAAWLYKAILGIFPDPADPGFHNILLKTNFITALDWAEGYHDSPFGRISVRWKRENGKINYKVTVPANSTATIHLPALKESPVLESGKPIQENKSIRIQTENREAVEYHLMSGSYSFEWQK